MTSRIFRRVALDRLESPEELDQLLCNTGSRAWIALLGVFSLFAVALLWGIKGSIPVTVGGRGMIVRSGRLLNVVSRGAGIVTSVDVAVGQHVRTNQVIARITQLSLSDKLRLLQGQVSETGSKQQRELKLQDAEAQLKIAAIVRERANTVKTIETLEEQERLAAEQVPVAEQLLAKGLFTRQQTIAAREKVIAVRAQIDTAAAKLKQLDAEEFGYHSQVQMAKSAAALEMSNLVRNVEAARVELRRGETVVSPDSGEVLELKIYPGGMVTEGMPILSIQPDVDSLEAVAFLPAMQAKAAGVGMEAQISPSTVRREEAGYLKGRITFVGAYPATPAAIMRSFQNESMLSALTASGPVTEVRIALDRDAGSASGFLWSSLRGRPTAISSGMICDVEVVTKRRTPLDLAMPFLQLRAGLN